MQTRALAIVMLVGLLLLVPVRTRSSEASSEVQQVPSAKPALVLSRGICIDRQFRTIPPEPIMRFTWEDIRLIKSMGFEFVKLIAAAPIAADIKKVNSYTVDGAGQTGTEWGPA